MRIDLKPFHCGLIKLSPVQLHCSAEYGEGEVVDLTNFQTWHEPLDHRALLLMTRLSHHRGRGPEKHIEVPSTDGYCRKTGHTGLVIGNAVTNPRSDSK